MGSYINGPTNGKTEFIIKNYSGMLLPIPPRSFLEIPEGKALIVVAFNGPFDAAGYAYNEGEFRVFTDPDDIRHRDYILIDKEIADKVASLCQHGRMTSKRLSSTSVRSRRICGASLT